MYIFESVIQEILSSFPRVPPENGGILGQKDGIICSYLHDRKVQNPEHAIYVPDIDWMNDCIQDWAVTGIEFAGIVHSHPGNNAELSEADKEYIHIIMRAMPDHIAELYFPVILPGIKLIGYTARKSPCTITIEKTSVIPIPQTKEPA